MDRRKLVAQHQLETFLQECKQTMHLLNQLIEINTANVNTLQKIDNTDIRLFAKYFLQVSQFQHMCQQKVLELNIDLEEFMSPQQPQSFGQFTGVNSNSKDTAYLTQSGTESPVIPVNESLRQLDNVTLSTHLSIESLSDSTPETNVANVGHLVKTELVHDFEKSDSIPSPDSFRTESDVVFNELKPDPISSPNTYRAEAHVFLNGFKAESPCASDIAESNCKPSQFVHMEQDQKHTNTDEDIHSVEEKNKKENETSITNCISGPDTFIAESDLVLNKFKSDSIPTDTFIAESDIVLDELKPDPISSPNTYRADAHVVLNEFKAESSCASDIAESNCKPSQFVHMDQDQKHTKTDEGIHRSVEEKNKNQNETSITNCISSPDTFITESDVILNEFKSDSISSSDTFRVEPSVVLNEFKSDPIPSSEIKPESSCASDVADQNRKSSQFVDTEQDQKHKKTDKDIYYVEERNRKENETSITKILSKFHVATQETLFSNMPVTPMANIALKPCLKPIENVDSGERSKSVCSTESSNSSKKVSSERNSPSSSKKDSSERNSSNSNKDSSERNKEKGRKERIAQSSSVTRHTRVVEIPDYGPLNVGDVCTIGHVISPTQFYIQVADENSIRLDELTEQLSDYNSSTSFRTSSKIKALKKLGMYCSVKMSDYWFRAEIIDNLDETDEVVVGLVDYGNVCVVHFQELRPLPSFFHTPRIARLCHLPYLYPPGSTADNKLTEWNEESIDAFLNICGDLSTSTFRVVYARYDPEMYSYEIDLERCDAEGDESLGTLLNRTGIAVEIFDKEDCFTNNPDDLRGPIISNEIMGRQIQRAQGLQDIKPTMSRDEILDVFFKNNPDDEDAENINEIVLDYDPQDEAQTCKNMRPDGTCYKGDRCKFRHNHLKNGFTTDKEQVYGNALAELVLPQVGDVIRVVITRIVDIQCFYVQLRNEQNDYAKAMEQFMEIMNDPQKQRTYNKFKHIPSLHQLVIVRYGNGQWYRGLVRSIECSTGRKKDTMFRVFMVDFGEVIEVGLNDLRVMLHEFLHVPFQAVECRLYNVKHKEGADKIEEKSHFESNYLGKTLKARVVSAVPGHLELLLENHDDKDIGTELIEKGYGEFNDEHFFPSNEENLLID